MVAPCKMQPTAMMAAGRDSAAFFAAKGISHEPGTQISVTSFTPCILNARFAPSTSAFVIISLKRDATITNRLPAPDIEPSILVIRSVGREPVPHLFAFCVEIFFVVRMTLREQGHVFDDFETMPCDARDF